MLHNRGWRILGHRFDLVRYYLLNGHDPDSVIDLAGSGWPEPDLVLSLQVLAILPDFPTRLTEIAEKWLWESDESLLANLYRSFNFGRGIPRIFLQFRYVII